MIILFTVRLAIMLIEGGTAQLHLTVHACKVLRMPRLLHGIDNLSKDGFLAGSTDTLGRGVHTLSVHVKL